jgi:3-phenylpropionate/trans-cinnamate dioxygenase ferredoxin subunit
MPKFVVGRVDAVPPGAQTRVVAGRRGIAIFNVAGTFYALRDACPHQGACLSSGVVLGHVTSQAPGQYEFDAGRRVVKCPRHGYEYELATGRSWYPGARDHVRAYEVSVEPGSEVLDAGIGTAPGRGPLRAEVIPISVEDEYIVVEV